MLIHMHEEDTDFSLVWTIMGFLLNPFALFDQLLFLSKLLFLEQQIPCSLFLFL